MKQAIKNALLIVVVVAIFAITTTSLIVANRIQAKLLPQPDPKDLASRQAQVDKQHAMMVPTAVPGITKQDILSVATFTGGSKGARFIAVEASGVTCPICRGRYPEIRALLTRDSVARYWINMDT